MTQSVEDEIEARGLEYPESKITTTGFQDHTGALPRIEYENEADTNKRARGEIPPERRAKGFRGPRKSSTTKFDSIINEPSRKIAPVYPFNIVHETISGHVIEYDDTPGKERIRIQHRTGTMVELSPNGDATLSSKGSLYNIVAKDSKAIIRGNVSIVVEGGADIRVKGNTNLHSEGDLNQLIDGDYNLEVLGNMVQRVHGTYTDKVTLTRLEETRGSATYRYLTNKNTRIVGTDTTNIGGAVTLTGESTLNIIFAEETNVHFTSGTFDLGESDIISRDISCRDLGASGDIYAGVDAHIVGTLYADALNAPTYEGVAKRAEYADTAGLAGSGTPVEKTPSNTTPSTFSAPTSLDTIPTDVTNTSNDFILALDRKTLSNFNRRILSTEEFTSRARNVRLLNDPLWLQDAINAGTITNSISSTFTQRPKRSYSNSQKTSTGHGNYPLLGNTIFNERTYKEGPAGTRLHTVQIPERFKHDDDYSSRQHTSERWTLGHFMGADSEFGRIVEQLGLTPSQISDNLTLLSLNVLEKLYDEYENQFTVSEGVYNPWPDEIIAGSSFNVKKATGLGVGIQFPGLDHSVYFDAATWIAKNLVFDHLELSYISYDPLEENEPTLLIGISAGVNNSTLKTSYNHLTYSNQLDELIQ